MTGIILCGGLSTRMGSDKGLIKTEVTNWATDAARKLQDLGMLVKASINTLQEHHYTNGLPGVDLITDNITLPVKGPLLGLLSAHIANPTEDLFVLACDMPLMETTLLKELYNLYQKTDAEAFIFTNEGEAEPLCAIYTSAALQKIMTMLQEGQLTRFSMKFTLDNLRLATLPLKEDQKKYFRNFNAHADLNGL
ncbi:molybdenum cofactor guanylyltransferase [Niabella hibiscisoli]|uniref:molybdenum cofactor guanylyltransferase n=1 Tax=Niabella hibiscisoli TaxID=1825928 RepID=UPI001F0FF3F1|nr:molybdenum cofactor guanylyltransferase [Niabella hibiscisoli]MCH5717666.1 molybdenum cofactor guanylyltransferase [Niabella hibiscisoli]